MLLSQLLQNIPIQQCLNLIDRQISAISHDSRQAGSDAIFVAIRGEQVDGRKFINSCAAQVVIVDQLPLFETTKTIILVQDIRKTMGILAAAIYEYPSTKMKMVGFTGTNGKTTTSWMLSHILRSSSLSVGIIGTLGHKINDIPLSTQDGHTTPESPQVQALLQEMVRQKCDVCIMEVSSIGLSMERVRGIAFDVVSFSNFTQDHLDFHGSMNAYLEAKRLLFQDYIKADSTVLLNQDQEEIATTPIKCGHRYSFGHSFSADWHIIAKNCSLDATHFSFTFQEDLYSVSLPIIGEHNIQNAINAIAAAHALNISVEKAIEALEKLPQTPGRLEKIKSPKGWFAFVDYAHTPDALEKSLQTLSPLTAGKLIVVFGCGGDRDQRKRPLMGSIAEKLANKVIITSDNPRTENPLHIINDILDGCTLEQTEHIIDRKHAIEKAISLLEPKDILLVAGKGHENYQIIGTTKHHFDDREIIRESI